MAKAMVKMPEEFLIKVSKLAEKTDEIVPKVLKAGADVVESQVRENLSGVIGKDTKTPSRSTGTLLASLGTSPARVDKNGDYNVKIGFSENRKDGKRNGMIAALLEYGKQGQPPKPFLTPAKRQSKKEMVDVMTRKLEEEIDKI